MKTFRISMMGLLLATSAWTLAQSEPSLPGNDMEPVSQDEVMPLIRVCESCHGSGGQTTRLDVPALAGKKADFILATLEQFYYYERHCPDIEFENDEGTLEKKSMCDVTNALNKQEALSLASYFENMPPAQADD